MKFLNKMISITPPSKNAWGASLLQILAMCVFSGVFALPMAANAQSSACVAGETLQTFSFPAGSWVNGTTGPYNFTVGAGATAVNLRFSITGTQAFSGGSPTQATLGNIANTVRAEHTVTGANVLLSTQNLTFLNRPVNKLRFISADVDSNVFQDTISTRVNGTVLPTSLVPVTPANITINAAAGTATANYNGSQCGATSNACNVTSNFNTSGITSASQTFLTGPLHQNATQYVGWNTFSWCLPALANITLRKTWVSAALNDAVTVAAAGGTPALTSLASVANTASETDTGAVQLVPVNSALTLSEAFTTGSAANYNTSLACTGTTGLSGSTLTVGASDTNIVCTYTNRSILSALTITKTDLKTVATSGGTNNYVVSLSNAGPAAADAVVLTDVVGAGLTCPGTNVVTCSGAVNGAVCPAASTIAALTGAGIPVATLPVTGALQFAYNCNVN
jgi:trimeric autotransporter adhesin